MTDADTACPEKSANDPAAGKPYVVHMIVTIIMITLLFKSLLLRE